MNFLKRFYQEEKGMLVISLLLTSLIVLLFFISGCHDNDGPGCGGDITCGMLVNPSPCADDECMDSDELPDVGDVKTNERM